MRIGPCAADSDRICGTIVWLWQPLDDAGRPRMDSESPQADLRNRPLIGREILNGFAMTSPGRWEGGKIYNPEDGRIYEASILVAGPDALTVEGCFLFICKKQVWRSPSALCSPR